MAQAGGLFLRPGTAPVVQEALRILYILANIKGAATAHPHKEKQVFSWKQTLE